MYTFILIVHIIVSIVLIAVVLMQTGKGAELGAMFGGGGSQTIFGPTGPAGLLGKLTAAAAIIFMITSLTLAYMSGTAPKKTIMEKTPVQTEKAPPQKLPEFPPVQGSQPQPSKLPPATPSK
jgi:preprotein translocase subunit SecG